MPKSSKRAICYVRTDGRANHKRYCRPINYTMLWNNDKVTEKTNQQNGMNNRETLRNLRLQGKNSVHAPVTGQNMGN